MVLISFQTHTFPFPTNDPSSAIAKLYRAHRPISKTNYRGIGLRKEAAALEEESLMGVK